eukprot:TRINITY_DN936_c0_g1_i2.p1 TRINITY_DN936_c0_g1~~TRINITY_DN936_c0_g1_i2.p1  ORF type:complete len:150 (+),score=39.88 TRINITY_DN936_c0_g1_i2:41-451(+)
MLALLAIVALASAACSHQSGVQFTVTSVKLSSTKLITLTGDYVGSGVAAGDTTLVGSSKLEFKFVLGWTTVSTRDSSPLCTDSLVTGCGFSGNQKGHKFTVQGTGTNDPQNGTYQINWDVKHGGNQFGCLVKSPLP